MDVAEKELEGLFTPGDQSSNVAYENYIDFINKT